MKTADSALLSLFMRTNGKCNTSHTPSTGLSSTLLSARTKYSLSDILSHMYWQAGYSCCIMMFGIGICQMTNNRVYILCTISLAISYVLHLYVLIFVQCQKISNSMTRTGS